MALSETVTGDGKVVEIIIEEREIATQPPQHGDEIWRYNQHYKFSETREWYALTKNAIDTFLANLPTPPTGFKYSFFPILANPIVNSWTLRRVQSKMSMISATSTAPAVISPASGEQSEETVTVTLTSATLGALIYYETAAGTPSDPTANSAFVESGASVEVPVPGTIKALAWAIGRNPAQTIATATYTLAEV
jgi:hypothetical protein